MKRNLKHLALCATAFAISSTQAGTVEQAVIVADPQMQINDGAILGCGYRLKSVPQSFEGLTSVIVLDTSFNIYANGMALLKGGAVSIAVEAGSPGKAANRQIESFWMKAQGETPTKALNGKLIPAENQGYILYGESISAVAKLFAAVTDKTQIVIGARVKGEGIDRIYAGIAHLSNEDRDQGAQCLSDLVKQMKADLDPKTPDR